MKKAREISRERGGDGVETDACSLVVNSSSDGQPVEMSATARIGVRTYQIMLASFVNDQKFTLTRKVTIETKT